jgi:hypothetical protein
MNGPSDAGGQFFPVFIGMLNPEHPTFTYTEGTCFKKIVFSYDQVTSEDGEIEEISLKVDLQ